LAVIGGEHKVTALKRTDMIGKVMRIKGLRGAILTTTALVGISQFTSAHADTASNQSQFETALSTANADPSQTITITGSFNVSSPAVSATNDVTINLGANTLGVTGLGANSGSLTILGSGGSSILSLTGTNSFNGLSGTNSIIAFDSDAALGTGPITLTTQSFQALQDASVSKNITLAGLGASFITSGHVMTITGDIGGNAPLIANGGGTLVLSGTNGYTGQTIIDGATLQIGDGGTTGSIASTTNVALSNNGTLAFNRSDDTSFNRAVSGSGLIVSRGTGTVTLSGAMTNGGVQAEAGSGGVILTGNLTTAGTSYNGNSPAAVIDQGGTHITINGSNITAMSSGGLEDGVQLNGGMLTLNSGSITSKTSGVYVRSGGGVIENAGSITGGDSGINFTASGTQSMTVTGAGSYTGGNDNGGDNGIYGRSVNGNVVLGTTASSLGAISGAKGIDVVISGSGALDIVTGSTVIGNIGAGIIATAGTGAISIAALGNVTANGAGTAGIFLTGNNSANSVTIGAAGAPTQPVVLGAIGIRVAGAGTTTLTNYGTISARNAGGNAVQIDAGTLVLEQSGTINGNIAVLGGGSALTMNAATPQTLSSTITGTGRFNQNGSGLLTLTGVNSASNGQFSGTVNVNAGILAVNGTLGNTATNGATVNVNAGGTFHGSGTIAGSVNVASGGTVSAGNSPGTLTVNGNYTLTSGSTSLFELGTPNVSGGAGNDLINVGGNLTLAGTLSLVSAADASASPVAGAYRLYNYGGTLSGSFDAVTTPTAQSASVYTTIPGQVNLLIANAGQSLQYWDGSDATGATAGGQGGTGNWIAADTNWTGSPVGDVNTSWGAGVGIFAGSAGTVTVMGAQDIQGLQFTVDGYQLDGTGTLNLTGDPFSTPNQSFINVDGGVGVTIANTLTSTGGAIGLVKLGAGTLTLSGTNSYTGATSVTAGTLAVAAGGSLLSDISVAGGATFANAGTVAGAVTNGGALTSTGILNAGLTNSGTAQVSGQINGTVRNDGDLLLTGTVTGIGTLVNDGLADLGGTAFTIASLSGTSTSATLRNGQLTVGSDNGSTIYAGTITDGAGTTSLTKTGSGTLTLSGASSYTGATTVGTGALNVTGSLTSAVTVSNGALLTGTGTIGSLAVANGATVAPSAGGSIGVLTVAGNVTFAAGSTYQLATTPAGQSDRITASGTATIAGGTVRVLAGGTTYSPSTSYTILSASGGVTGTFANVTTNLAFLTPYLDYTGNAVTLNLTRNDISFVDVAQTRNQRAVATAIQGLAINSTLPSAIVSLDAAGARSAYNALSGESYAAVPVALIDEGRHLREALLLNGRRTGDGFSLWGDAMDDSGRFDRDASLGTAVLNTHRDGVITGINYGRDGFRASIATGYSSGTYHQYALQSRSSVKSYYAGSTVDYRLGALHVQAGGTYSWHTLDNSRSVAFTGFTDALRSRQHGNGAQGFGELGYTLFDASTVKFEPFVGYSHQHVSVDPTTETGGAAALTVARVKRDIDLARLGFHFTGSTPVPGTRALFEPRLSLAYQRSWGDRTGAATVALAGAAPFEVAGAILPKDAMQIDGGFGLVMGKIRLGASYLGTVGDSQFDHGGRVTFGIQF
jgi:autotransporter-associated beta strand protein